MNQIVDDDNARYSTNHRLQKIRPEETVNFVTVNCTGKGHVHPPRRCGWPENTFYTTGCGKRNCREGIDVLLVGHGAIVTAWSDSELGGGHDSSKIISDSGDVSNERAGIYSNRH